MIYRLSKEQEQIANSQGFDHAKYIKLLNGSNDEHAFAVAILEEAMVADPEFGANLNALRTPSQVENIEYRKLAKIGFSRKELSSMSLKAAIIHSSRHWIELSHQEVAA